MPEITNRISASVSIPKTVFKSGLLGNYFVKASCLLEGMKTMKTFKDKNPLGSNSDKSILNNFMTNYFLTYCVNLTKNKNFY